MEEEKIVSGYCRQIDQSRMVLCEYEKRNGKWHLCETDCQFPDCAFADNCSLAKKIQEGTCPD